MAVAQGRFDIGRVFTRAFTVMGANAQPFFLLGLVATVPRIAYTVIVVLLPDMFITHDSAVTGLYVLSALASLAFDAFIGLVLQAAVTYGSVSYLGGQQVSLGRAVGVALRHILPLIAIGLLEGLGLLGAFTFLIFPAFMLYAMWCTVVPVRVTEETGILRSFGRSRELTGGYRWPIFGVLVILILLSLGTQLAVRPLAAAGAATISVYAVALLGALVSAVAAVFSATLHASIYYELRVVKEGVGPQQIAAIFD